MEFLPDHSGEVKRSITINRSPQDLYAHWRDLEKLPGILSHVKSVTLLDAKKSHWKVEGPAGSTVEWDAEITEDIPGEKLCWQSIGSAAVENSGKVEFKPAPRSEEGTEIHVYLTYTPPGGVLGRMIAGIFHKNPNAEIADDLRRFKQVMELGRIPTITGQPAAGQNVEEKSEKSAMAGGMI